MSNVGTRIKNERMAAGLSQPELASMAGTTKQAISQIERGVTKMPAGDTIEKISHSLMVSSRWILTGKGPKRRDASQSVILDPSILSRTFNTITAVLREDGRYFDMNRHAEAFAMLYAEGGEVEPGQLGQLREMLISGHTGDKDEPGKAGQVGEGAGTKGRRAADR